MFHDKTPTYFGVWFEESQPARNRAHALQFIAERVEHCDDQEIRTQELLGYVAYLRASMTRPALAHRFLQALAIEHPDDRIAAARKTFATLRQNVGDSR